MPADRTWCIALCLLAAPLRDAYAAGAVSHHLAASARRHAPGPSLLQVKQTHTSVHSHGVTPDFFEDASASAVRSFNPVASGETAAAVQEVAAAANPSLVPPPEALAAVASHGKSGAKSSMQLLPTEPASQSMMSSMRLNELSSEAGRIFSLVAEGARAAVRNVAPSWFNVTDSTAKPLQAAEAAQPGTVAVDATRGHKRIQPMAAAELGHSEAKAPIGGGPAQAHTDSHEAAALGAMSFFSGARRRPDGSAPAAVPVAMIATGPAKAVSPAPPAAQAPERDEDAMEVVVVPQRTQAELQARRQRLEAMRAAEAREAREHSRQADLEDKMESVRLDFGR
mmetsp:Transcript_53359/g.155511  ORF Transcript_53359/g.155511 Transcript_53359/m.155511 type:complete len:339 (+) Transcript_53359:61-1077(+)